MGQKNIKTSSDLSAAFESNARAIPAQTNRTMLESRIDTHLKETLARLTYDPVRSLLLGGARTHLLPYNEAAPHYVYVAPSEDIVKISDRFRQEKETLLKEIARGAHPGLQAKDVQNIEIRRIPRDENGDLQIPYYEHGPLYIPNPALKSGEMRFSGPLLFYWDTAFTIRGLLDLGQYDEAKHSTENMLYQAEHYDGPLNANSTFCLNNDKNRSQLPLLTGKVLHVAQNWAHLSAPAESKADWLKQALPHIEKHHAYWVTGSSYDVATGLSKFDTTHDAPGVEVMHCEPRHYEELYKDLSALWAHHKAHPLPIEDLNYEQRYERYYAAQFLDFDDNGTPVPFRMDQKQGKIEGLSAAFFRGDWSIRASGFDLTERFGPGGVDIIHHLPVCLNALRFKMEHELSRLYEMLAEEEPSAPQWVEKQQEWQDKSLDTRAAIHTHLWDDGARTHADAPTLPASFRDKRTDPNVSAEYGLEPFRKYDYASAFFPLWAGLASDAQAKAIVENILPALSTPYGLKTSTNDASPYQWDGWMIWPPLQMIAVKGLLNYGYEDEALELAENYVTMLQDEYARTGCFYEKMEGLSGTSNTARFIGDGKGYAENDIGFGWTIGVYADLKREIAQMRALKLTRGAACSNDNAAPSAPDI